MIKRISKEDLMSYEVSRMSFFSTHYYAMFSNKFIKMISDRYNTYIKFCDDMDKMEENEKKSAIDNVVDNIVPSIAKCVLDADNEKH